MGIAGARAVWVITLFVQASHIPGEERAGRYSLNNVQLAQLSDTDSRAREERHSVSQISSQRQVNVTTCPACLHGGTSVEHKACLCLCPVEWQGQTCAHNKLQVGAGIELTIEGSVSLGYLLWPTIVTLVAESVTYLCMGRPSLCCPDADFDITRGNMLVLPSHVRLGSGYPMILPDNHFSVLLYAYYNPHIQRCSSNITDSSSLRQRPDTEARDGNDTSSSLQLVPQDVLWQAVGFNKMLLRKSAWECCGLVITSFDRGQVEEEEVVYRAPLWLLVLMCSFTVSIVFASVVVHIIMLRRGEGSILLHSSG